MMMPISLRLLMFFSTARFDTPILFAMFSAVIDESEMIRSMIFWAVQLTFLGSLLLFAPNYFRLQGSFRGYYLPCWQFSL